MNDDQDQLPPNSELPPIEATPVAEFADADTDQFESEAMDNPETTTTLVSPIKHVGPVYQLENMAAEGGVVGGLVLGSLAVIGSFVTNWSIVNGVLGLLFSIWGASSDKKRLNTVGLALSLIGIGLCLIF